MNRAHRIIALVLAGVLLLASASPALGITRAEIVYRGKRWVEREVPYSQTAYYDGYRTDCSGMASMTWRLPMSYSTRTLAGSGYLVRLGHRDQLQPGDMLNKYDYHAAIFYKWANADHTWYWTLEQSGGQGHAVMRLTPFPYWGHDGFYIYRHRHIEEVNDYAPYIREVAGPDRYATAVAASALARSSVTATHAVICSGENWPDALGGSALAGALDGPVLLVKTDYAPAVVLDELRRLAVQHVVIVGSEEAITPRVASRIDGLPGVSVERIGGVDRYDTAAKVASRTVQALEASGREYDRSFYLATGQAFPDALGAATVAAYTGRPILLTEPELLPRPTATAIASLEATMAYVTGGTASVGRSVVDALYAAGITGVRRFSGPDRYATSLQLAQHGADEGLVWDKVAVATGEGFVDALAGAGLQAKTGSPLVLTRPDRLGTQADWAVREHLDVIGRVRVLGGDTAVQPIVRRQIRWIIDEP